MSIDEVSVPDSLLSAAASAELRGDIVAKSDSLPWIVGGGSAAPGEPAKATVWTSDDGTTWSDAEVGELGGSFTGNLAGSADLAVLAGTVWTDGRSASAAFTTTDGNTWSAVDLPAEFRDTYRLHDVAVTGEVVYGIGGKADAGALGLRIDGDTAQTFALPEVGDDEVLSASAIAANGETVVLVASPGTEDEVRPTVTYRSDDAGETWGDPVELTDKLGDVSGIVALGDGFLATGAIPRDDAGTTAAAAWFSADGESWAAEAIPSLTSGALRSTDNADVRLGAPLARDGAAAAIYTNDNSALVGVYTRGAGGDWSLATQSTPNSTNGGEGVAMPTGDGGAVVAIAGPRYARLALVRGGTWTDTQVLAERDNVPTTNDIYPGDGDALIALSRSTFTVDADLGWRNSTTPILTRLEGDTLTETGWDPPRAAELLGVQIATADDGSQIVLGSYFGEDTIIAEGSFRSAPDAAWTPMTGFQSTGATNFYGVSNIDGLWVGYGTERASSAASDPSHGHIWTSTDGTTWTRAAGDFGSGSLESSVSGVCALPDGALIGIGWVEESAGEYRPAVWRADGATWTRVDIGELGSKYGFGISCASGDDGVILRATVGQRDTLLSSADGQEWEEVFRADRGVTIGTPVAVEGGFVASGTISSQEFSAPVVWLSKTGAAWSPVTIPSFRDGSTGVVAAWGDDVIVTMSAVIGSPVSIIRDIATVIENEAP